MRDCVLQWHGLTADALCQANAGVDITPLRGSKNSRILNSHASI
jgi:hypothetical protein